MKFFGIVCCIACLTAFSGVVAQADLVAYWSGDNTPNDASGNMHHGTLQGDTSYATGVFGNAFSFDGNGDYVEVTADPALEPQLLSVSLWLKTIEENHIRLLADSSHGFGGSKGWALQITAANNLSFAYGNGANFNNELALAAPGLFDGDFHHIAATLDGTDLRLYLDGNLLGAPKNFTGTPTPTGENIRLGDHYNFDRALQGQLDEVRIFNHALSQSEITSLAAVPEPGSLLFLFGVAGMMLVSRRK